MKLGYGRSITYCRLAGNPFQFIVTRSGLVIELTARPNPLEIVAEDAIEGDKTGPRYHGHLDNIRSFTGEPHSGVTANQPGTNCKPYFQRFCPHPHQHFKIENQLW